jgi:dolichyl-phosphate beta-glucosyltransferase
MLPQRSFIRNLLMHGFHMLLALLLRPPSPSALLRRIPLLGSILAPSQRRRPHKAKSAGGDKTSSSAAKDGSSNGDMPRRTSLSSILSFTGRQALPVQPEIRDTQCGFKLFTRQTAATVFPLAHIERWIFDVELLLLAEMASKKSLSTKLACEGSVLEERRRLNELSGEAEEAKDEEDPLLDLPVPIAEVAVHWEEVGGSKIDLLRDSIGMAVDLLVIRANYAIGTTWKSPEAVPIRRQEAAK